MKLERFGQPIVAKSVEEHESLLNEKMAKIQLDYIGKIIAGEIPVFEKVASVEPGHYYSSMVIPKFDFAILLPKYSFVLDKLIECFEKQKRGEDIPVTQKDREAKKDEFIEEVDLFFRYDKEHWIEKTIDLLREEQKKVEKFKDKQENTDTEHMEGEKGVAGIMNFNVGSEDNEWFKNTEAPIKKDDICISVHLEPLFRKTLKNEAQNIFSSGSLEKLAIKIVDQYPQAQAIIGRSWIMDTPIAKRIGFSKYEIKDDKYESNGGRAFWGQFVNMNGQIEEDRVKKFLETGVPQYKTMLGVMHIEDFLKKYLPKERKGAVVLKERNPEYLEFLKEKEILKELYKHWNTYTEEEVKEIVDRCVVIKKLKSDSTFLGLSDDFTGEKVLSILLKSKKEGKKIGEVLSIPEVGFGSVNLTSIAKENEFINKEVIIE